MSVLLLRDGRPSIQDLLSGYYLRGCGNVDVHRYSRHPLCGPNPSVKSSTLGRDPLSDTGFYTSFLHGLLVSQSWFPFLEGTPPVPNLRVLDRFDLNLGVHSLHRPPKVTRNFL